MKSNEFDQLLSGLLDSRHGDPEPKDYSTPQKISAASEQSRRRVEEIMRNVEMETDKKKAEAQPRTQEQPFPKREPVVVPPPISHFSDEPSQNPAVRMRDRLDETALPMIDSERKPTQIIPPKPKPEPAPKKKKKKPAVQPTSDIPAPPSPPKRNVPHIVVPDELPPDIPRETAVPAVDEERQKKLEAIRRAVKEQRSAKLESASQMPEPTAEIAEPTRIMKVPAEEIKQQPVEIEEQPAEIEEQPAEIEEQLTEIEEQPDEVTEQPIPKANEQEILSKAQKIKQQIRLAMEEVQSIPEPEELTEESEELEESSSASEDEPEAAAEVPETADKPAAAPGLRHLSMPVEPEKKPSLFSRFRRKKEEISLEQSPAAPASHEEDPEITAELPEEPELYEEPETAVEPELYEEPETAEEPEQFEEPETAEEPEQFEEPETAEETEQTEESEVTEAAEVSIDVSLPSEEEKARKRSAFAAAIRAALDENAQELADVKAEQLPDTNSIDVTVGKSRKGSGYFMVGIICSIFAVVGFVFCVMQSIRLVRDFIDSKSLKSEMENVMYPVVVMDLPEFENPADAAPDMLMSAAVMDILMYGDLSQYTEAFDVISIPAEDVKKRADAMFGISLPDEYVTLFAAGELFFYDESTGCYNVPSSPVIFSYAPEVQEIHRTDDVYTVTVVYRADTAQWQQRSENFTAAGEKRMEFTLQEDGDTYRIIRIKNVSKSSDGI